MAQVCTAELHVLGSASDTQKVKVSQKTMGPVNASHRKTGVSRDRTKVMPHVAYSDLHELSAIDIVNLPSVDVRTL